MSSRLRPGVAQGLYPERRSVGSGRWERALRAARVRLGLAPGARHAGVRGALAAIARREGELRAASAAQLGERIGALRRRLGLEGLCDAALIDAFALIREVARRELGTPHYDVQIMGGWLMARGMLAEMATGEGKTLTASLPAAAAALAGIPVHVVSANDYLVTRDAAKLEPLYAALGLRVGTVTDYQRDPDARRAAYTCDVTYGTTKQIAFDYLRDRLIRGPNDQALSRRLESLGEPGAETRRPLLRGLCFAIIDEADSVLIDEGRTPLILSRNAGGGAGRKTCRRALRLAASLVEGEHFELDLRNRRVGLTEAGHTRLREMSSAGQGLGTGPRQLQEWVTQALRAHHLFERDRDYLVRDGAVHIIDQPTGRVTPDRSWERGLHQLIEVKEDCEVSQGKETLARISYQQFYRRYLHVGGMSGTLREVASELWTVYGLATLPVPTRLPVQRRQLASGIYRAQRDKWRHVVDRVAELHAQQRAVLVGTCSVAASEDLSARLEERGLPHRVLNARNDAEEAEIVARAGEPGAVTVATHMAGRGTDIELHPEVHKRGGLHVICTQLSDAGRIDRQLFGRAGRQGDPGSCESILSLEDEPVALYYPRWFKRLAGPGQAGPPLSPRIGEVLTRLPQRAEERRHASTRRGLLYLEEQLNDLLAFSGRGE